MFTKINENEKKELTKQLQATFYSFSKNINFVDYFPIEGNIGVIEKGEVLVKRTDAKGDEIILDLLVEGEMISSIFYPFDEMLELTAKEDVRIMVIEYQKIVDYNGTERWYQQFLKNYNRLLNDKIAASNQRINYLLIKTIRAKLLFYFECLANKQHRRTITLPFSYTELASYLSIDRSAMNRELKNLKDERIILTHGRKVSLLLKDLIKW